MKKSSLITIGLAAMLGLVACNNPSPAPQPGPGPEPEKELTPESITLDACTLVFGIENPEKGYDYLAAPQMDPTCWIAYADPVDGDLETLNKTAYDKVVANLTYLISDGEPERKEDEDDGSVFYSASFKTEDNFLLAGLQSWVASTGKVQTVFYAYENPLKEGWPSNEFIDENLAVVGADLPAPSGEFSSIYAYMDNYSAVLIEIEKQNIAEAYVLQLQTAGWSVGAYVDSKTQEVFYICYDANKVLEIQVLGEDAKEATDSKPASDASTTVFVQAYEDAHEGFTAGWPSDALINQSLELENASFAKPEGSFDSEYIFDEEDGTFDIEVSGANIASALANSLHAAGWVVSFDPSYYYSRKVIIFVAYNEALGLQAEFLGYDESDVEGTTVKNPASTRIFLYAFSLGEGVFEGFPSADAIKEAFGFEDGDSVELPAPSGEHKFVYQAGTKDITGYPVGSIIVEAAGELLADDYAAQLGAIDGWTVSEEKDSYGDKYYVASNKVLTVQFQDAPGYAFPQEAGLDFNTPDSTVFYVLKYNPVVQGWPDADALKELLEIETDALPEPTAECHNSYVFEEAVDDYPRDIKATSDANIAEAYAAQLKEAGWDVNFEAYEQYGEAYLEAYSPSREIYISMVGQTAGTYPNGENDENPYVCEETKTTAYIYNYALDFPHDPVSAAAAFALTVSEFMSSPMSAEDAENYYYASQGFYGIALGTSYPFETYGARIAQVYPSYLPEFWRQASDVQQNEDGSLSIVFTSVEGGYILEMTFYANSSGNTAIQFVVYENVKAEEPASLVEAFVEVYNIFNYQNPIDVDGAAAFFDEDEYVFSFSSGASSSQATCDEALEYYAQGVPSYFESAGTDAEEDGSASYAYFVSESYVLCMTAYVDAEDSMIYIMIEMYEMVY